LTVFCYQNLHNTIRTCINLVQQPLFWALSTTTYCSIISLGQATTKALDINLGKLCKSLRLWIYLKIYQSLKLSTINNILPQ